MITGQVTGSAEAIQRLKAITPGIRSALEQKIQQLTIKLQRKVVSNKLQGQALNVRTGRLQRSIEQAMVKDPQSITGIVSTNVVYARIHEYGGVIHMPARMSKVYRSIDSKGAFRNNGRFAKKSRSNFETEHETKAYDIHMPERSFLRSALADMREEILAGINDAVKEGLRT